MPRPPPHGIGSLGDLAYSTGSSAVVFTLFVAAGSAYVVLAKLAGVGQAYVTFVPVAIMFAYALLIWLARNLRLRDDQAGDNLYYMGFLFTLTSLGVSLYQFNATGAAEEIVQNFGIAIGSTITGIALRVIFNQMRQDPVEVERTMRLELAEAARRVRRELDSTVVEFGYARRSAHQAAVDSFGLVAKKFDEIAARLLASLADSAAKSAQPLEAASRRSADMVEQLMTTMVGALAASTERLAEETGKLSNWAGRMSTTLDEITTRLDTTRTTDAATGVALEPLLQSLTRAIDRLAAQSDAQAVAVRDAAGAATAAADSSSASIIALRQDIAASSAANGEALEGAAGIITAMAQILDEFEADARTQAGVLRHLLERTDGTIRGLAEVVHRSRADIELATAGAPGVRAPATAIETMADDADDTGARQLPAKSEAAG
jgi:hypothetical protein